MKKFAIVVSRFNEEVTNGLTEGAKAYLQESGVNPGQVDVFPVPGAFEIPLVAQTIAKTGRYSGVICLGCVIKGETAHFEYISLAATMGILQSTLATEVPITFGVLTTYNDDQALERSKAGPGNKGRETAQACLDLIQTLAMVQAKD